MRPCLLRSVASPTVAGTSPDRTGPASLSLEGNALPSGYYLNISVSNGSYTLARVLALERVVLSPAGFTTVSVDAPTVVAAAPRSGQGTPSPANLSFAWSISGTGWQVLSSENTSSVTVEPLSTTYVATVEVWANGTYGGATLHAPPVSVLLTAATTAIQTGAVEPTSVDEGVPASFTWSGTGAEGYPYTASLKPGFALPAVGASCSNRSISGGLLEFECTALYTYPERGVAQPFATLSNAYSGANYSFSPITVSATLVIGVTPIPAVEYAGVPIDFAVKVESGSGSAPYGPACLSDGIGHTSCQRTPGQPWMFPVTYPFVGQYRAEATVADSGGANYTDLIPVTIVHSLSLGEITLPRFDFPQGGNVSAYDQVFGGAFPLNYWWNTSTASTVGRGTNGSDGNLSITFPAGKYAGPGQPHPDRRGRTRDGRPLDGALPCGGDDRRGDRSPPGRERFGVGGVSPRALVRSGRRASRARRSVLGRIRGDSPFGRSGGGLGER